MNVHSVSARAAAVMVAGVAGAASFEHIASVAIGAGERAWVGYALPLAIDGLILVGVAALLEDRRAGRIPRHSARLAVLVGVIATLAANVASAEATWTARLVAVAAPVSFLLSVEVLTRTGRRVENLSTPSPSAPDSPESGANRSVTSARPARRRSTGKRSAAEKVAAARAKAPAATQEEVKKRTGLSLRTVARYWRDSQPEPAGPGPNNREHGDVPELAEVSS